MCAPPPPFWKHPCHPARGGAGCQHVLARSRGSVDSRAAYFQREPGEKPQQIGWQKLNTHCQGKEAEWPQEHTPPHRSGPAPRQRGGPGAERGPRCVESRCRLRDCHGSPQHPRPLPIRSGKGFTSVSSVAPAPAELVTMPNRSFLFFSFSSSSLWHKEGRRFILLAMPRGARLMLNPVPPTPTPPAVGYQSTC